MSVKERVKAAVTRKPAAADSCPQCGAEVRAEAKPAAKEVRRNYCDVCGYDLIQRSRDTVYPHPTF